jgi:hypothetical protein
VVVPIDSKDMFKVRAEEVGACRNPSYIHGVGQLRPEVSQKLLSWNIKTSTIESAGMPCCDDNSASKIPVPVFGFLGVAFTTPPYIGVSTLLNE